MLVDVCVCLCGGGQCHIFVQPRYLVPRVTKVRFKSLASIFRSLHTNFHSFWLILSANDSWQKVLYYDVGIDNKSEEEHDENEDEKKPTP